MSENHLRFTFGFNDFTIYLSQNCQVWTEVQSGVGAVNFITGAGGFLQALISGFAGVRIYPDYLEIK